MLVNVGARWLQILAVRFANTLRRSQVLAVRFANTLRRSQILAVRFANTLRRARTRRVLLGGAVLVIAGWAQASCGARTPLYEPPPPPPKPPCHVDEDCHGFGDLCNPVACQHPAADGGVDAGLPKDWGECVALAAVNCDDNDPCTNDTCDPSTGKCSYALATLDLDGDGYRAPLPGTIAGAPGSCGDDCDDTNPNAHPGGLEVCDGADNDCNGVVDDNAAYVPLDAEPIRISGNIAPAGPGGLGWSGTSYAAIYTGTDQGFNVYQSLLAGTGDKIQPESLVTLVNADASGGPIVWIGDRYGIAWQDRRDSDYEVYFTELSPTGGKVYPDTRITFAQGFSVNVSLAWNGLHFVLVWQDDRDGLFNLYGQVIGVEDTVEGSNIPLTADDTSGLGNEGPSVAAGTKTVGVAWTLGDPSFHFVEFRTFDPENQLAAVSMPIPLTDGSTDAVYPVVVWNKDRYVVAWFDKSANPTAIYAAAVDENGNILTPPRPITSPGFARSRYPFLRALGDRLLVIYSDDRDGNDGYELYARTITKGLDPLGPEQRLTFAAKDSIYPIATFGPNGDVGILFQDNRAAEHDVYFMRLGCVTTMPP
jgi:hypothetical protein